MTHKTARCRGVGSFLAVLFSGVAEFGTGCSSAAEASAAGSEAGSAAGSEAGSEAVSAIPLWEGAKGRRWVGAGPEGVVVCPCTNSAGPR